MRRSRFALWLHMAALTVTAVGVVVHLNRLDQDGAERDGSLSPIGRRPPSAASVRPAAAVRRSRSGASQAARAEHAESGAQGRGDASPKAAP
jgi:hypothetical protein